jgi:glutamate dehydrogenase (NAD(P)+)
MSNIAKIPSYLSAEKLGPWDTYLVWIDRVEPHLNPDPLSGVETLTRLKRALIVDAPIRLEDVINQRLDRIVRDAFASV